MRLRLFRSWWLMTLKGLLAISFGLMIFIKQYTLVKQSLALAFGILMLSSGVLIILGAFIHKKTNPRWVWWLIEGAIDILISLFFIIKPDWARALFLNVMAIWAVFLGIIQIITALRLITYMRNWWTLVITGVLSIALAVTAFFNPLYKEFAVVVVVGIFAVVFGLIMIYISRILRNVYL
ncbi:MAG: DUF308 domain-containing protein [Bacteroidales bacterium]|nr:DUF308 domain-containing protein [Bacteroidales bacterium]